MRKELINYRDSLFELIIHGKMERQIMIKHQKNDNTSKIEKIISLMKLYVDSRDEVICDFCLNNNQAELIEKIKFNYKTFDVKRNKKSCNCKIIIWFEYIEQLLNFIETYDINAFLFSNDIRLFINDNDGDFIIINTNHNKYNMINNAN